jgi:hypothetical protein
LPSFFLFAPVLCSPILSLSLPKVSPACQVHRPVLYSTFPPSLPNLRSSLPTSTLSFNLLTALLFCSLPSDRTPRWHPLVQAFFTPATLLPFRRRPPQGSQGLRHGSPRAGPPPRMAEVESFFVYSK